MPKNLKEILRSWILLQVLIMHQVNNKYQTLLHVTREAGWLNINNLY